MVCLNVSHSIGVFTWRVYVGFREAELFFLIAFGWTQLQLKAAVLVDRRLAAGEFGGRLFSYDFEERSEVWGLRGHDVVNCIDGAGGWGSGAAEMVTGGREGSVKVWDVRVSNRETVTLLVLYLDQIRFDMDI